MENNKNHVNDDEGTNSVGFILTDKENEEDSLDKNKKYYIGIDAGTNSVGFCVTDQDYNILKIKGKELWGVRLFDEGQTAGERRQFRTNRRRLRRRRQRLQLLRSFF